MTPNARIIETERSVIPPEVVLQNFIQDNPEKQTGPYQHDLRFKTQPLEMTGPVDTAQFATDLIAKHPLLVRAKGFVIDIDGAMKTIQIVGQRFEVSDAPAGVSTGVVLIETSPAAST